MKFRPSMFRVIFEEYRDRTIEFSVKCIYVSERPVDGVYERHTMTLLGSIPYDRYLNNYPRIVNLCTPTRMGSIRLSEDAIKYDSAFSIGKKLLFTFDYSFCYADEMKRFILALEHYGIDWDYDLVESKLPF